ncbi:hypothetical protein LPJ53_002167 [Coemansia erecta]|uniref:Uncharacterized protein n=1 Tax=Coemansia erecta TaxID=147472 RepID=A0A9W7Y4V5_9FUNG|nr:hypothetical protein LPJ53_002167 [Coemansia erecta]
MRRAQGNMSWSDSMSSSITLTGSRVNVGRQHRASRLRPPPGDQTLQRLVRELHASRIVEEPEDDEDPEDVAAVELEPLDRLTHMSPQPPIATDDPAVSSLSSSSRSRRVLLRLKRRAQRLAYLVSYHMSQMWHQYAASNVLYRPLQMGIY